MSWHRTAETVDSTAITVPYWIVTGGRKHNSKVVHIPAEESTRDNPRAVCPRVKKSDSVKTKDTAVFPPGYCDVCRECLHYRRNE